MTQEEIADERWNIDFGVSKSMRYHTYRRSFWQNLDYSTKVFVLMAGTAAFASVIGSSTNTIMAAISASLVALASAADIVIGFTSRARLHDKLYREFCLLGLEITDQEHPPEEQIAKWRRRRLEIEMEEPGTLDWLERRCSAEEARARGTKPHPSWILSPAKVFFSQLALWQRGERQYEGTPSTP